MSTLRPLIADCTGEIYFTDLQLQEGDEVHTTELQGGNLPKCRGGATLVLFNTGETSAGLDLYIYPKQPMAAGSIEISQGMGSHKCKFTSAVNAGDNLLESCVKGMSEMAIPRQRMDFTNIPPLTTASTT